jgi:CRP-like cAMP-binding protein
MVPARIPAKKTIRPVAGSLIHTDNQLLAALAGTDAAGLIDRCERVHLPFGEVLAEPGAEIRHVYFPTGSFVSLISSIDRRERLEVGLVGAEGMLGVSLLMGVNVEPLRALVQGAGSALRIEAAQFLRELERSSTLRQVLNRYLYVLMSQLAQMARCTSFHVLEARFARWLLMTRDRAHSNEFRVTQEFMAYMLGVRRVGVTQAAGALQRRKLIRYTRGKLIILNNAGLEAASCACYASAKGMYAAVTGINDSRSRGARRSRRGARHS